MKDEFPILEFDPDRTAIIEPVDLIKPGDVPEHCVLCFFLEVIEKICGDGKASIVFERRWEDGVHRGYRVELDGRPFVLQHPGVGAPCAVATLEELIPLGCRKFIVCGGAGVLDKAHKVGDLMIPTAAIRDEGTSYHYQPPSRTSEPDDNALAAIRETLRGHGISFQECLTWTTDAAFRETRGRTARRLAEGCLTVEMEAASLFSAARFRGVPLAQMLYAGDAVVSDGWDHRGWTTRVTIREKMLWLAAEACLRL